MPELFSSGVLFDQLSIFFTILVISVFIPVLIYSVGYISEYKGKYSRSYNIFLILLFTISMIFVLLAKDGLTFMVFWEIMSASSFFLVIYEHRDSTNIRSGVTYFIMTHLSGFFLMVMFALIFKYTGTMNFDDIILFAPRFSPSQTVAVFIFAVAGFGAKAGFIPVHAWLPMAHPCAPSNASALMSGVMLKISLYGLIRTMFYFLANVPLASALVLVVIGAFTAIYGILNALVQKDIKKLLAYSSAENIGIILSTIGLSLVFKSYGMTELSAVTLLAALFHILNHGVFKSLLFLSAGSVLFSTGTKNMNELGGLYKKMKFASICAFIGTAAISAIPPLNGFASEFMIFTSFIKASASISDGWSIFIIMFSGVIIALTSGGALYASVKSFGITYLGSSRSEKAENPRRIPLSMNVGLGILSVFCIALGILSPWVIKLISKVVVHTLQVSEVFIQGSISYELTVISAILLSVAMILALFSKIFDKNDRVTAGDTWGCGFDNLDSTMQYSGNGFSQPVTRLFSGIVGYSKQVHVASDIDLGDCVFDVIERYLYKPVVSSINALSQIVVQIHSGRVQIYVMYIFVTLSITLLLVHFLI